MDTIKAEARKNEGQAKLYRDSQVEKEKALNLQKWIGLCAFLLGIAIAGRVLFILNHLTPRQRERIENLMSYE